jgi:hypothetical protein
MDNFGVQGSLPFYEADCDASTGKFLPHVRPEESKDLKFVCSGLGSDIIDCKNPDLELHLKSVNSLDLNTIKLKQSPLLRLLPDFIPIIEGRLFDSDPNSIDSDYIGVSLKDILKRKPVLYAGRYRLSEIILNYDIKDKPLFKKKKVILFLSGIDELIEVLWRDHLRINFFGELAEFGFFAITAANFSVFGGECGVGLALNIKRSLHTTKLIAENGQIAIPHFYWLHQYHLNRIANWLKANPQTRLITVNTQLNERSDFLAIREGISYLLSSISDLHILLEGPSQALLSEIGEFSSSLHVALKNPSSDALNHVQYFSVGPKFTRSQQTEAEVGTILKRNIKAYKNFLYKMKNNGDRLG